MKISCCIVTTNCPTRFDILEKNIDSILSNNNDLIDEYIISVDCFPHIDTNYDFFYNFKNKGFKVYIWGRNVGLALNQQLCINKASNDFIFYVEDKVLINKFPKLETIKELHKTTNFSFIFYNCHLNNIYNDTIKNYILDIKNYLKINDSVFLKRDKNIVDNYKILFPVAIFEKNMYNNIYNISKNINNKKCIELSLSDGFMRSDYYNKPTFLYLSENILENLHEMNSFTITNKGNNMDNHPIHGFANMKYYSNGYKISSLNNKYINKCL